MANVPGAENGDAPEATDPFADKQWSPEEVAYNGKIINVRLSDGSVEREDLPEQMYKDYLGGYGIGARLLFDRVPAGADPLGPDNVLGLMPGLLTGTPIFGNRFQAVCKSPSTGGWGDANCGGDFGPYLKFAGWDGILFYGQAANPVYILIDGDNVSIEDASEYWGMGAIEVENAFKEMYGKKTSVACIGPSGEQLSYLAGICNEHGRLAARSGVGAVMGSKKVKAVVVRAGGTPRENMLSGDGDIRSLARQSRDEFIAPLRDFFAGFGTTGISTGSAHNGDSPVRNWGGVGVDVFPEVDSMSGMMFNATRMTHAELEIDPATGMPPIDPDHSPAPRAVDVNGKAVRHKSYGCWRCPMACGAESIESPYGTIAPGLSEAEHEKGVFKYPVDTHRAEYETVASFGTMNLSANIDMMQAANHWCNEYGLDTIGAGTTISFAIECFENGLIDLEDTGGVELTWSNDDGIMEMLHLIGKREGFGDLLADGMKVAAEKIDAKNGRQSGAGVPHRCRRPGAADARRQVAAGVLDDLQARPDPGPPHAVRGQLPLRRSRVPGGSARLQGLRQSWRAPQGRIGVHAHLQLDRHVSVHHDGRADRPLPAVDQRGHRLESQWRGAPALRRADRQPAHGLHRARGRQPAPALRPAAPLGRRRHGPEDRSAGRCHSRCRDPGDRLPQRFRLGRRYLRAQSSQA